MQGRGAVLRAGVILLGVFSAIGAQLEPPPTGRSVSGTIRFGPEAQPFRNAILNVSIVDTTAVGLPRPEVLTRRTARGISWDGPDGKPLRFVVHNIVGAKPDAFYSLRVHIDLNGDGRDEADAGDYESVVTTRVLKGDGPENVEILVRRVDAG